MDTGRVAAVGTERGTGGVFFGGVDVETRRVGAERTGVVSLVGVEGTGTEGMETSFFEGVVAAGTGIAVFVGVEITELFEGDEGTACSGTVIATGFLGSGIDSEGVEVPRGTGEETIGVWIFDT